MPESEPNSVRRYLSASNTRATRVTASREPCESQYGSLLLAGCPARTRAGLTVDRDADRIRIFRAASRNRSSARSAATDSLSPAIRFSAGRCRSRCMSMWCRVMPLCRILSMQGLISRLGSMMSAQPTARLSGAMMAPTTGRIPDRVLPDPVSPRNSRWRHNIRRSSQPAGPKSGAHSGTCNPPAGAAELCRLSVSTKLSTSRSSSANAAEIGRSYSNSSL